MLVISPPIQALACAATIAVCSALTIDGQVDAKSIAVLHLRMGGSGFDRSNDGMRVTKKRHMDWGIMPLGDLSVTKNKEAKLESAIGKKDVG